MKIALVHNEYGRASGEEAVVNHLAELLRRRGHEVVRFSRGSAELSDKLFGRWQAFFAGIYNPFARRQFARFLDEQVPEAVHIHNLFPLISPSILPECGRRRLGLVATLHNFRLVCPNALLMRRGRICHECLGGHEWRCIRHNCEGYWPKSLGYAARTACARRIGWFHRHVNRFICLTGFQRELYVREGFPRDRMTVIPNPAPCAPPDIHAALGPCQPIRKGYVGYVGRVSPEKDLPTLMEAARRLPRIRFKVAGTYQRMQELLEKRPSNLEFLGYLERPELDRFYAGTRVFVFATRCYEGFPTVILESMARALPIVCARIGGLPEIIEDGQVGLLYRPGNAGDLTRKIERLWKNPELRARLGTAAGAKAQQSYSEDLVYRKHMEVYAATWAPPAVDCGIVKHRTSNADL